MGLILILEHTNILGYKMKRILTENGFPDIEIVKDYHGINLSNYQSENRPDCIIVDLDDRNHDMILIIQRIRKELDNPPIISMSGDSNLSTLKRAIGVGCREFILKPFETETLVSKVFRLIHVDQEPYQNNVSFKTGEMFQENAISLRWSDDYLIGVEQIDLEHKKIFEHFNMLYSMMREGHGHEYYPELMEFLTEYVDTHFEHEEEYQRRISFEGYEKHKASHDEFRVRIKGMMESDKNQKISDQELISICLFIKDWLIHHIMLGDMKIKGMIKSF